MKVLLTGASGYLGSNLVRRLLTDGYEVAAFKRRESNLSRLKGIVNDIAWYYADQTDLSAPFKRHDGFDAVVHTATCYGRNGESPGTIFAANVAFPVRLLDTAIYFNTDTFFNTDTYFNTDTILSTYLNLYSFSKKQFAEWGKMVSGQCSVRFINIRLEHIYGPLDDPSKFTTYIIHQCLENVPAIALTPGEQMRDFIYINDVIDAYSLMLKKQPHLPIGYLNVGLGSGGSVTIRRFVELVHRFCGSKTKLNFGAIPYRDNEIMASTADLSFLSQLGWKQNTNLEAGLIQTIEVSKKFK